MEMRNCPQNSRQYIWSEGDTLLHVALEHGVSQSQLRNANPGVDFEQLSAGSQLCIPPRNPQCTDGVLHTVKRGDTIWDIARAHGVSAGDVIDRNPYVDPNRLQLGMLLCIPPRPPAPPPAPTPAPIPTPIPTPPPSPAANCPPGYTSGAVRYQETYGDILLRYNISYQAFRLSNPQLTLDRLLPGQRYCIPPMGSRGLCQVGANSHVMDQGENLLGVASRFQTTPAALLRLNANLAPADFVPGRVICV